MTTLKYSLENFRDIEKVERVSAQVKTYVEEVYYYYYSNTSLSTHSKFTQFKPFPDRFYDLRRLFTSQSFSALLLQSKITKRLASCLSQLDFCYGMFDSY